MEGVSLSCWVKKAIPFDFSLNYNYISWDIFGTTGNFRPRGNQETC